MTKFEEIIKNGTYEEFKEYCENNDFIIEESVEDNSYIFSLTRSDTSSEILINGIVTEDSITLYVTDEEGNVIDKIEDTYDNESELLSYLKGALVTSNLLSGETGLIDDDEEGEIFTEDEDSDSSEYSTIPGGLEEIENKIKVIGDSLKDLSGLSNSLDITSIIMDLANSAYSLALDVDGAIEQYNEIMEIPEEEELEPEDGEVSESKKISEAKMNMVICGLSLRKLNSISEDKKIEFENICKSIFD